MPISREHIDAINAAGEALKLLGMGPVRLRYGPADHLIVRDTYTVWIDAGQDHGDIVGVGPTPEAALFDALGQLEREAA